MAWRAGHGSGAGVPHIEVLPPDEMPVGVPAETRPECPGDRGERGRFAKGNSLAAKGGKAKTGKTQLSSRRGRRKMPVAKSFEPYERDGELLCRAYNAEVATTVGAGTCGVISSRCNEKASRLDSFASYFLDIAAALGARKNASAEELFAELDKILARASYYVVISRQNVMAAVEIAAKQAMARRGQVDTIDDLNRRLGIGEPSTEEEP